MIKKIILLVAVLGIFGGGFFYWWNNQNDVRELNKTLPDGVKVVKSLFGNEYSVVNKIDNYSFKVPNAWKGVDEIAYIAERNEKDYLITTIEIAGKESSGRIAVINRFTNGGGDLVIWAKKNFENFELVGDFSEDKIRDFEVVKTQENVHLGGMWVYFFKKDTAVYALAGGSEKFIKEIILNGKW